MAVSLTYENVPGFGPVYWQLLTTRRSGFQRGQTLPALEATWANARFDRERLQAYCKVCDWPFTGKVPILYPHVLSSAMHIALFSQPSFPVSLFGAVHARFHAVQHRSFGPDTQPAVHCRLAAYRVVKQGLELDVTTVLSVEGARIWESISTYLARGKKFGEPVDAPPRAAMAPLDIPEEPLASPWMERSWPVPFGEGRRYAKVCGDYNPIHIGNLPAKLFGFPRAIIHGMWSSARCLSELPALPEDAPQHCGLIYKGPVFIGDTSTVKAWVEGDARRFELYCTGNPRPCMQGELRVAHAGERLVE
ncbi:MAG: hypothetical protein HYV27_18815 [Candidatus Hydrogenedentes bacterium]|nr:hypothetical protein [Candidatus Hydrogenedentota bacterium]